ncbi:MAG: cytochrome-c peroxidase [Rhodospirillales bacterium]|nr:cytochrome-c peroxidase [Rhodospirillales bacterium]
MRRFVLTLALAITVIALVPGEARSGQTWSGKDTHILRTLWIGSLPRLAKDPSNGVGDDPRAATLGQRIFFDKQFSGNGTIACATCHQPDQGFADGLPVAKGMGTTTRNTPTIIGTAHSPWFFWDGRTDSQWSQALGPMEAPTEHGGARTGFAKIVYADPAYRRMYEEIFGSMPDISDGKRFPVQAAPIDAASSRAAWNAMAAADHKTVNRIFANIGKAIAAYERLIMPGPSRFDKYVDTLLKGGDQPGKPTLSEAEIAGLRLFIGEGKCTQCHNGPLLTNNEFHNTGLSVKTKTPEDEGRARGALKVRKNPFNCLGAYSDAGDKDCAELDFIKFEGADLLARFKTPTLRNVGLTAPYMHDGQFSSLGEVLAHYNQAPDAPIGKTDILALKFSPQQLDQLRQFLLSLDSPVNVSPEYLLAPKVGAR